MGDSLFVHGGVTSALEARLALAGLLALQGPTALDVRTGVLVGPGSTTPVTGTSATAPMQVAIGVHDAVLSRGAANGPYVMPTEAVQLVNIGAAPASGTRIDVVYEKQQDSTPGIPTPDATTGPLYGVLQGTVGAGKPSLATIVGAEELATVAVSAGATRTTDGAVLITNTARQTVARGARIPVRSQAEQDALTAFKGLEVYRLDNGQVQLCTAIGPTAWVTTYDPALSVPLPVCSVRQTTTQGVTVNTWTPISFGAEDVDPDGLFDLAAPTRITVSRKGIYRLEGLAAFFGASADYRFGTQLTKNGTALPSSANGSALSGQPGGVPAFATVQLNPGDYVGLNGVHSFGPSLGTAVAADTASLLSVECLRLLP